MKNDEQQPVLRGSRYCPYSGSLNAQVVGRRIAAFAGLSSLPLLLSLLLLLLAVPASSQAGPVSYTARISNLLLYEDGDLVYVYLEGDTQGRPSCAGANGDYLSFSMKRPRAKEYLAALMLAFAQGRQITVRTDGACTDQPMSDTLRYFTIHKE